MNIWLLLSGDYAQSLLQPSAADVVIAVDGGMAHARRLGVTPSLWIGDFDSTSNQLAQDYQHITRQKFPQRKDDTDLGLALNHISETYHQIDNIHLIGAFGNEFDHVFANFWLLPQLQIPTIAWGASNHAIYLPAKRLLTLTGKKEQVVSVFALTHLSGVNYQGLEWPLHDADIKPFTTMSARNYLAAPQASISWQRGDGLIVISAQIIATIASEIIE